MRLFETQQESHEARWVNLRHSAQCNLFIAGTACGAVSHRVSLKNSSEGHIMLQKKGSLHGRARRCQNKGIDAVYLQGGCQITNQ